MSKIKRAGAWLLAAALTVGMLPAAGAAVTSDRAKEYLKILNENSGKNSYLIDFDGDGNDELVLVSQDQITTKNCDVWSGTNRAEQLSLNSIFQPYVMSKGDQKYLAGYMQTPEVLSAYTLKNGKWVEEESLGSSYNPDSDTMSYVRNGVEVSESEFSQAVSAYQKTQELSAVYGAHSVREQLANAVDTLVSGYEDVLNTLSASEKKALFEDFLYKMAGLDSSNIPYSKSSGFDSQTASDGGIVSLLVDLRMDTSFPIKGGPFTQQEFTAITQQYFGRTIDYNKFSIDHEPVYESGYASYYYNGKFYLCSPQRGSDVSLEYLSGKAQHLYAVGGNTYYAAFTIATGQTGYTQAYVYSAIVKKNADNTWRLVRLYPSAYTPTAAELAAFVQPSSWAKAEVEKAQAANLVPDLTGDPGWQDSATRLQFAELAVQFVEQATGQTLAAAPSGTFSDTSSEAVLKASAVGIVNGTSATEFSPYASLTREQLATMLWRAISYVQTETGKTAVTSGGSLSGYTDASKVSGWAKDAVAALAQNGIMKGTSGTTLSPAESCTVEQSVLLVYRTFQKLQ